MSNARNIARLYPNSSGILPATSLAYAVPKAYSATTTGAITTSQTRATITFTLTNSTNRIIITGSDLLRCSSGYIRGQLLIDGSMAEGEFMYLQANSNLWVSQTGIYTANNLSVGSHTIALNADFSAGAGGWDSPTYLQAIVWDGSPN